MKSHTCESTQTIWPAIYSLYDSLIVSSGFALCLQRSRNHSLHSRFMFDVFRKARS